MDIDNYYDPYAGDDDFGGPMDFGFHCDDDEPNLVCCNLCHESCCRKKMSQHDSNVCRFCCPVCIAEYQAERDADEM